MSKNKERGVFAVIQKIGRSFFLPVSILPIAGLLLGLGASFTNAKTIEAYNLQGVLGDGTILNGLLIIMSQVGSTIFGNLPLIFAMAVALGMAKNEKAVSVLSSGVSFFVMHSTINAMLKLTGQIMPDGSLSSTVLDGAIANVCGIDSLQMGVFGGIVVGLVTAGLHNRFYKQQLPAALSFFAGVRFVPIISVIAHIAVGVAAFAVWPVIQKGIFAVGNVVMGSGYFGTFVFGFMERALIPFGLHHVFYIPFWQTGLGGTAVVDGVTVAGAQNIFFAELASPNVAKFSVEACRFMTGKYPFMMAGLPAAAYAMYTVAKPENKKVVGGLLVSAALTSFLTGITEPIEFTFLFIAPALFVVHCVFAGLAFVLMHLLDICIGTTFSCGLIDFTLYGLLQGQAKTNWLMILPVFAGYAALYYVVFRSVILKFNLATPGREENADEIKLYTKEDFKNKSENKDSVSAMILQGLGGLENIIDIDCCATRLRLTLSDTSSIKESILKKTGSKGVIKKGNGIQVIYGPHVSIIKSEFEEYVQHLSADPEAAKRAEAERKAALKQEDKEGSTNQESKKAGKKAAESGVLKAAATGTVIPMEEAKDEAFACCMMGNGVVICPEDGKVVAPADGEVTVLMEGTNHAVGIHTSAGFDILIHIGIDTVHMKGEGFKALVAPGQKVKEGDTLVEFDKDLVCSRGLCPDVIVISLDNPNLPEISYETGMKAKAGETVVGRW
ncbi:PTS transporter subunit IIABC [Lacrimispora sp.]|uniref:PTS transporter subunit IIABC n=1 Tax=Lacrimispora sp. TaxID=2719234 RepID=UPI002FDA9C01